jgi:hypothetical protein
MSQTPNEDLTLDPTDWNEFHALAREMIDTTVTDLKGLEAKTGWSPLGESDKDAFRTPLPYEGAGLRAAYADFLRFAKPFPFGQYTRRFWGWAGGVGTADGVLASLLPRGRRLGDVVAAASRRGFRAVPTGVRFDVRFRTEPARVRSHNVIGVVPGTDPALRNEHVVLSAHWDAYGIGRAVEGDSIYNGALDDGSGVTLLLALARVFAANPQRRSITFLFTTAEEWGLLGARAFVCGGPVPAARMAANLNVDDGIELFGVKRNASPLGIEHSTLARSVERVAGSMGLAVTPDPYPEQGFFLRADNFPFALAGVPALYMALGTDAEGRPAGYIDAKVEEYLQRHYHRPSDEYETVVVDLAGAVQFANFVRDVTIDVANSAERPQWFEGSEFQQMAGGTGCAR